MKNSSKVFCLAIGIAISASFSIQASAMPENARQETIRLIDSIGASGCEFERNGQWYKAGDAANHLKRKLDATQSRLQTTEQFITHVASSSSISGKPYRIRCKGSAAEEARPWLERKLTALRGK